MGDRVAYFGLGALVATMAVSSVAYDAVNKANNELAEHKRNNISLPFKDAAKCPAEQNAVAFNKAVALGKGGEIAIKVNSDNSCGYDLVTVNQDTGETEVFALN